MSLIGVTLFMTSCLEEGNQNYSETSVAYIAADIATGRVYGRTISGRLITSPTMQLMLPGSFQFLRYSWVEEDGKTPISVSATSTEVYQADNVVLTGDPVPIQRVPLLVNQDPPQVENRDKFVGIDPPVYATDPIYLGDHWLLQYAYEAKRGESANVNFYYTEDPEAAENEITIVIDLAITGEPEAGSSATTMTDIIALNMSQLRAMHEGSSTTNTKELNITFKYYLKDRDQIVDSPVYRMTVKGD